jgi:glycosyltransferase involved in cell wall biosynthesis
VSVIALLQLRSVKPGPAMRIALFTETFIPKIDGIVTTLCETARQLRILGHEVLIFAPDGGIPAFEGARIIGMKGRSFALYPELQLSLPRASMRADLQEFRPDLLHVADPALLGVAALYYGGGTDGGALHLPLVISYHTDLPAYLHYYRLGFLEPHIWRIMRIRHNRATLNLCTSTAMMEQLTQHGIERVALWPGGVDTARFHPDRRSEAMRARLTEGHPGCPLLVYVGRLSPEKDIERLKPILEALPGTRLALVGDGPHREALRRHFEGMPVYLAGFLRGEELAAAYASSDALVMPSRTETLGLVVLEAMSSGLPVAGARAGGIPEMIEDGVSGCLFDRESEAVEAIRPWLMCPEKRRAVGTAARSYAVDRSWKAATVRLVEHYKTACAEQNVIPEGTPAPAHPGLRSSAKQLAKRTTMYAIRKLLP